MKSIRVKTGGWMQGRNRLVDTTTVVISESYGNTAVLYGIDKHERVIGGGLSMPTGAMDDLAVRWLQARCYGGSKHLWKAHK